MVMENIVASATYPFHNIAPSCWPGVHQAVREPSCPLLDGGSYIDMLFIELFSRPTGKIVLRQSTWFNPEKGLTRSTTIIFIIPFSGTCYPVDGSMGLPLYT